MLWSEAQDLGRLGINKEPEQEGSVGSGHSHWAINPLSLPCSYQMSSPDIRMGPVVPRVYYRALRRLLSQPQGPGLDDATKSTIQVTVLRQEARRVPSPHRSVAPKDAG